LALILKSVVTVPCKSAPKVPLFCEAESNHDDTENAMGSLLPLYRLFIWTICMIQRALCSTVTSHECCETIRKSDPPLKPSGFCLPRAVTL
jgi:hypothetical protein